MFHPCYCCPETSHTSSKCHLDKCDCSHHNALPRVPLSWEAWLLMLQFWRKSFKHHESYHVMTPITLWMHSHATLYHVTCSLNISVTRKTTFSVVWWRDWYDTLLNPTAFRFQLQDFSSRNRHVSTCSDSVWSKFNHESKRIKYPLPQTKIPVI